MQEITGDQAESSEVCIANIGPKERRRRLNSGLVMLVFSSGIALATLLLGAKRPYRLLLFLLFSSSFTAIFQYFEKT